MVCIFDFYIFDGEKKFVYWGCLDSFCFNFGNLLIGVDLCVVLDVVFSGGDVIDK